MRLGNGFEKSHVHNTLAELFDIDRDFIESGIEKVEVQYRKDKDISMAYDKFLNYLKDVSEMPIYERHPDLAFLKDIDDGKVVIEDLDGMPDTGIKNCETQN